MYSINFYRDTSYSSQTPIRITLSCFLSRRDAHCVRKRHAVYPAVDSYASFYCFAQNRIPSETNFASLLNERDAWIKRAREKRRILSFSDSIEIHRSEKQIMWIFLPSYSERRQILWCFHCRNRVTRAMRCIFEEQIWRVYTQYPTFLPFLRCGGKLFNRP